MSSDVRAKRQSIVGSELGRSNGMSTVYTQISSNQAGSEGIATCLMRAEGGRQEYGVGATATIRA